MSPVALVTGGAVRVGRALTLGLADAGYDVVVHYHGSEAAARHVRARIEEGGRRCVLAPGDLSEPEDVEGVARVAREEFGRLDLLVNSASVFRESPVADVDAAAWDGVMDVNVRGPFLLIRAAADLLSEAEGSVVNVLDLSAFRPWTRYPHHSVSKAALLHLTRVLAKSLAPRVRVNAVAPGTVLPPDDSTEEELERDRASTPLRTLGSPEDVVEAVLFLARARFITGDVITVDGGRHLS